jgi:hypothetical protein
VILVDTNDRHPAERLSITTIATMNRRDFDNVRPRHVPAFAIVPN